ncbi:MAG: hypothetical protein Q8P50_18555 [Bacillota bacterium]|nr:hypothetical protein [Bacillota bacterium]
MPEQTARTQAAQARTPGAKASQAAVTQAQAPQAQVRQSQPPQVQARTVEAPSVPERPPASHGVVQRRLIGAGDAVYLTGVVTAAIVSGIILLLWLVGKYLTCEK